MTYVQLETFTHIVSIKRFYGKKVRAYNFVCDMARWVLFEGNGPIKVICRLFASVNTI